MKFKKEAPQFPQKKKTFNIAGPSVPGRQYMLPALPRLSQIHDLQIHDLIEEEHYFVIHAPRKYGKTTLIRAANTSALLRDFQKFVGQ
jgi:hypothetical protein